MNGNVIVEIVGYVGSALVLVSMLMVSVVKLRVINLIGSVIFSVYALIIRSYPTAVMNICLAGINVWHLVRLLKQSKQYDLIRTDLKEGYAAYLLDKYADDIRRFFPDFDASLAQPDTAWLISCDSSPAGLFLGRDAGSGRMEVLLDYALPAYRDTSVGRWLYGKLAETGCKELTFTAAPGEHADYLLKMGFTDEGNGRYVLRLPH